MKHLKAFAGGLCYIVCNYLICNIPSWVIRKFFYRLMGMKIGKRSRIMMKTIVTKPWMVKIGSNTVINEHCYLDGRGGLFIGDNVNVAIFSLLVTGTHETNSTLFKYTTEPIFIEDGVWIASRSTVLNGCVLEKNCIIAAGAVLKPNQVCETNSIYGGVPGKKIGNRELEDNKLESPYWHVCFR